MINKLSGTTTEFFFPVSHTKTCGRMQELATQAARFSSALLTVQR